MCYVQSERGAESLARQPKEEETSKANRIKTPRVEDQRGGYDGFNLRAPCTPYHTLRISQQEKLYNFHRRAAKKIKVIT